MDTLNTEQVYTGDLCRKCHRGAYKKALLIGGGVAALFIAEIVVLTGLKGPLVNGQYDVTRVKRYGALLAEIFKETFRGAEAFWLHFMTLHLVRQLDISLVFATVIGVCIGPALLLIWIAWQWKLARHGLRSRLARSYRAWASIAGRLGLKKPIVILPRPVPGPGGKMTP
jgi:hypothetical protein